MYRLRVHLLLVLLLLTAGGSRVWGQWMQPNRLQIGASVGFGGLHAWGKPSFDLHKGRLALRLSPGFRYLSGGVTWRFGFYRPKFRADRILTLNAYYMNDWYPLGQRHEVKRDQNIYMLMPGIHVNLDHRGTVYLEVAAGALYMHERLWPGDEGQRLVRDDWGVMGEVRIGGIFLSRKEHHQTFPPGGQPEAKRVKKKKLKFKGG